MPCLLSACISSHAAPACGNRIPVRACPCAAGLALGNVESIRLAHNSFARPEPLVPDDDKDDDHEKEAFHFVGYVPVAGTLYELDGLKAGPIPLASVGVRRVVQCSCARGWRRARQHGGLTARPCTLRVSLAMHAWILLPLLRVLGAAQDGDNWLAQVGPLIQQRIERYAASEIRFNLMALVRDRRRQLQEAIAQARSALDTQQQVRESGGTGRAWRGARAACGAAPLWRGRARGRVAVCGGYRRKQTPPASGRMTNPCCY